MKPRQRLFSLLACLAWPVFAQKINHTRPNETVTEIAGTPPKKTSYIDNYFLDKPASGSGYETGNLHIMYDDKTEIVITLPLKQKSADNAIIANQEGIIGVEIADDKRTIGWSETYDNCCTSYLVPLVLAIYRSGKTILHIQQSQVIRHWAFREGGRQVMIV